jgi:hypothetical protein
MTDLARLVGVLAQQGVDFIIVTGAGPASTPRDRR